MDSTFKQTLRAELDFQDIKVKELSLKTGISARTLEGYLSARNSIPPADVATKIAQVLNVSVEYLVTGNSNSYQKTQISEIVGLFEKYSKLFKAFDELPEYEKSAISLMIEELHEKVRKNHT